MTFASRMQHQIYWGPMKKPIEWSLKTVLAPWAYIASVLYHDSFWYPLTRSALMHDVLDSPWGRLFRNWETLARTADGFPDVGTDAAQIEKTGAAPCRSRSASSAPASRKRRSSRRGGGSATAGKRHAGISETAHLMTDFTVRSDNVDVEQIMRQIRSRIREKRGVDYTEEEIRELANVKLEKFLDPRGRALRSARPVPALEGGDAGAGELRVRGRDALRVAPRPDPLDPQAAEPAPQAVLQSRTR